MEEKISRLEEELANITRQCDAERSTALRLLNANRVNLTEIERLKGICDYDSLVNGFADDINDCEGYAPTLLSFTEGG